MLQPFRTRSSPSFERDIRRITKRNPTLLLKVEEAAAILKVDPYNTTRRYNIKKFNAVRPGEGQWRIRIGDYRIRYDVFGTDVVLYSFRHRKETY
jgi:mRNA-degrading endonuclease RelE of RelBE toxin-antitoxin system